MKTTLHKQISVIAETWLQHKYKIEALIFIGGMILLIFLAMT